ncbi:MXAN_2562 family outer membrane beta-barrel protein [Chondromyces apiculatus]|uniref:Outer membrane protein beta-barrel domain-containing protein n=1 Tax=Chondromyces apiculatus DSM 436 TaxID=1192034 RepID=A0A017T1J6_9BACT|nr:MXAN_2562 family outer membrane beta-barrel protein [Chondromyces apiculatus]EYF03119.1 Hypothetical protein CAP_6233 [Chondromyces apiculatus DSM 436]
MSFGLRLAASGLLVGAALLLTGTASAQKSRFGGEWRRSNRVESDDAFFSYSRFAFEARFGLYSPHIDDEFEGAATPYADVFNTNPQFYVGLEIDWLPFRIPYLGVLGPTVGWGYTWASAVAQIAGGGGPSSQDTSLWIMPMHASAVLRVDALMREVDIPIVPYAKFGFGWGLWSASSGDSSASFDGVVGRGTSLGTHLALGGMFSLNWLDSGGSHALEDATGLRAIYLFGEWMRTDLGGGSQMNIGTSTGVFGLAAQR